MTLIRIENSRASAHVLPPVGGFPVVVLKPGGNNVSKDYLDALKAHMCAPTLARKPSGAPETDVHGHPIVIHERGEVIWDAFLKSNPHLTILSEEASKAEVLKPQGPAAPPTLRDRKPEVAIAFIELEEDPAVLKKWEDAEKRPMDADRENVRLAIRKRQDELKGQRKK